MNVVPDHAAFFPVRSQRSDFGNSLSGYGVARKPNEAGGFPGLALRSYPPTRGATAARFCDPDPTGLCRAKNVTRAVMLFLFALAFRFR
jgi:hypothetical protein